MRIAILVFSLFLVSSLDVHQATAEVGPSFSQEARAASALWRGSCTQLSSAGTCFTMKRVKMRRSCQASAELPKLGKRKKKIARRAVIALEQAMLRFEQEEPKGASDAAAHAELAYSLAEHELEEFLKLRAPLGLDFKSSKKKRSEERFRRFVSDASTSASRVNAAFAVVTSIAADPSTNPWRVAALARASRVSRHFATLLYSMEIPGDVAQGPFAEDSVDAYCDALATAAHPLEVQSKSAASACNEQAAKLPAADRPSECERMTEAMGPFSDARVTRRIFQASSSAARKCHAEALKDSPGLHGKEALQVEVDSTGQVVSVTSAGLSNKALSACLEKSALTLVFPVPEAADIRTLHHEWNFRASF